jgi:DNA-binding transcriptional MerR regulator
MRQVSYILDIPQPTIRSWERRYGLRLANRSSGGHRRFTRGQVDQLRWMRDLVARGRSVVEAAAVVSAGHRSSTAPLVEGLGERNRSPTSR